MQTRGFVVLLTAGLLPFFAQAKDIPSKKSITPAALASMQAVVDFCSAVDARNAEYFKSQERIALVGVNEERVEAVRASASYHQDYKVDRAAYGQLPAGFGAAICAAAVPAGAGGGHGDQ